MRTPRLFFCTLAALTAAAAVPVVVSAQDNAADVKTLIEVLQLHPGSVVAEIGAGGGELTIALAQHVGPDGRVYTTELGAERVQRLRGAVEKGAVTNVEVIEGHERRANLPDTCCDGVFMRNVYHHFADPPSMHASFWRALKPGGRIAVIDFTPPNATAAPGKRGADGSHGVRADTVAQELKAAGFEIVSSEQRTGTGFKPVPVIIVVGAKPQ